MLDMMEAHGVK